MTKEVLDAGVVVVVLVVVVAPLVTVLGLGLRVIGKAGLAMADALENLRKSNDAQSTALQTVMERQQLTLSDVKSLNQNFTDLSAKISKLPPDIQAGVTRALDDFLDRLGDTLKKHERVPMDFSPSGNSHNNPYASRPGNLWARLLGL